MESMNPEQEFRSPELLELPDPPEKPDPRSCCERGCEHCIFDYYEKAMAIWHKKVAAIKAGKV